ncbi:MAG: NAD(P)-dependent oxidoreductase [Acidobacteria bacterium]|nr:NAD(P)-dependent oxidoreductase [Acidobacteriota bacterium]
MEKPTVIITGANGFIGSSLVKHFQEKNWQVLALVHSMPSLKLPNVEYYQYDLASLVDETPFTKANYLIHCAYIKYDVNSKVNTNQINIDGTKQLISLSRKYRLKFNIFLSSMSAQVEAESNYGKQKFALEKFFTQENDLVIRPGLVLGSGGLFGQMSSFIRKNPFIPLIDGGKQPLQTIFIDDLVLAIDRGIEKQISGNYTIAEPTAISYQEFYKALCEKLGVEAKFISVPYFLVDLGVTFFSLFKIKLPITKENLLGLKNLKYIDVKKDLNIFGLSVRNYKESLKNI